MFTSVFKNIIIILTSFYLGNKLFKSNSSTTLIRIRYFIFALLLAIITIFLKKSCPSLSYVVPAFCFIAFFCISHSSCSYSIFCISLTSYVINMLFFQIISFIFCTILIILFHSQDYVNDYITTILISILYPLIVIWILKINRVYQSVSSIIFNGMINSNTFTCLVALVILTLEQVSPANYSQMRIFRAPTILLCLVIILYWWRSQITKTYREKLRLLEIKTLRAAKAENEAYISKLEAENRRLGTIIHKDNRIVNAMADSVCDYLTSSGSTNAEELHEKGVSLSNEINSIKTYRQKLLCEGSLSETSTPQTKHAGVDAIIAFMVKEAASYSITLKFHYDKDFFSAKRFTATEVDFVHLLSDLLENAIIATRHAQGQSIELSLQILKGTPAISVSDSGIPFEINTLMKFGICEASTHTDEGGTGIGLIDIWSFKKKYHASLVIEELDNSIYSKRLSLLFDGKNKYLIISNRFQQIISSQTRADLLVINATANELTELVED